MAASRWLLALVVLLPAAYAGTGDPQGDERTSLVGTTRAPTAADEPCRFPAVDILRVAADLDTGTIRLSLAVVDPFATHVTCGGEAVAANGFRQYRVVVERPSRYVVATLDVARGEVEAECVDVGRFDATTTLCGTRPLAEAFAGGVWSLAVPLDGDLAGMTFDVRGTALSLSKVGGPLSPVGFTVSDEAEGDPLAT